MEQWKYAAIWAVTLLIALETSELYFEGCQQDGCTSERTFSFWMKNFPKKNVTVTWESESTGRIANPLGCTANEMTLLCIVNTSKTM